MKIHDVRYSIRRQPPMRAMLIGLLPCTAVGVYLFGWRTLALVLFCCLIAYLIEVVFETYRGGTPTESLFVSGVLLGLSLPPYTPFWIAAVGTIVGLVFGKQVFGGFGKNVFNPAILGRCFLYVCFPIEMTNRWMNPPTESWGRVLSWSDADAITSATPLISFKQTGAFADLPSLLLGSTGGSIGETSALAVFIGGAYILYKKAADWRYPVSCILGAMALNTPLFLMGLPNVMEPIHSLFAGSLLFGAFFMVTEPVSGCVKKEAKWAYGFLIGVLWIFIRSFSSFPEATAFAILLGNTFAPLLDEAVMEWEKRKKASTAA